MQQCNSVCCAVVHLRSEACMGGGLHASTGCAVSCKLMPCNVTCWLTVHVLQLCNQTTAHDNHAQTCEKCMTALQVRTAGTPTAGPASCRRQRSTSVPAAAALRPDPPAAPVGKYPPGCGTTTRSVPVRVPTTELLTVDMAMSSSRQEPITRLQAPRHWGSPPSCCPGTGTAQC
jgi:hypothetical protein